MPASISAFVYFFAGLAIVYLFQIRRQRVSELSQQDFPEMDAEGFHELIILLKTAYERMLYMGVVFFPLAYTSYVNGAPISKLVFAILLVLLFLSNIPPRNKIMRLLERYELTPRDLKERNIAL
ncbi:hypothetical protein JWJ90_12520 [Desulfobulbus rhabdoformis]|uniref:hypothetical protein n=1 Tax=Desulfobulbus rhabdoformis TaxID=34032 RepID=UPI0019640915|nr:hypothetical protein [Desulfobulbus rhabdoformis]MBM9615102.1 hypothetical protein [Desulfobulbus rhabdoformis]